MCAEKVKMPKIWEILRCFKDACKSYGWKTCENEDWVEFDGKYHNFLCARNVTPSSFKKLTTNPKCIVRDSLCYRVVEASYTAWLFSETPSEDLIRAIFENPEVFKQAALYDLSPLLEGKNTCVKLNHTDSPIFQEFEQFLKNNLKVTLKTIMIPEITTDNFTIAELA